MRTTRALAATGLILVGCSGAVVAADAPGTDAVTADVAGDTGTTGVDTGAVDGGGLPNGSMCSADSQCASARCVQSTGLPAGCAAACHHDDDCSVVGTGYSCAVDNAAGGPRQVCVISSAPGADGDPCSNATMCASNACVGGTCRGGCLMSAECAVGTRCVSLSGGAVMQCGSAPITGPVVEDYVLFDDTINVQTLETHPFSAPDDTVSLTFVSQDLGAGDLIAAVTRLQAPDSTYWIDDRSFDGIRDQPVREWLNETQINSALAPSSDTLHPHGGLYTVSYTLFNVPMVTHASTRHARGTVRIKRAPGGVLPSSGTLHVRFYFVGLSGISAASAASNARLRTAVSQWQAIYARVGITVVIDGYTDITGADASQFTVVNSQSELDQLLTRSSTSTGDVLNLFLVSSISASAGLEGAIGVAGDIVGPPGIHGTIHSGVVVGWDSTRGGGVDVIAQTMAHECGHYVGLWHTRESQPGCTNATQMMCSPFGGVDPISDTPNDQNGASRYLMFWQTDGTNVTLSPGEGIVMRSYPLVQ